MSDSDDVLTRVARWLRDDHRVALATVIATWGSSPRPPGSQLAIRDDGLFTGSVSGGCVEGSVVARAAHVIATGEPELLEFGVTNEQAWDVGLACGGRVEIWVEPVA